MKPQFHNLSEFLDMGGYAGYVFTAYGLAITTMVALVILGIKRANAAQKKLKTLEAMNDK